jgi:hypothetical protein
MYIRWAEGELSKIILLWIFASQAKHNSGLTKGRDFFEKTADAQDGVRIYSFTSSSRAMTAKWGKTFC